MIVRDIENHCDLIEVCPAAAEILAHVRRDGEHAIGIRYAQSLGESDRKKERPMVRFVEEQGE
jgi:hypothetical protein